MDPFPFKNTDIALKTFTPVLDGVKIPFVTATELSHRFNTGQNKLK